MSVINTNITALIGQQNLGKSQNSLQTAMERLSSGLRINSAADDAAGQAIANRMTSAITGLNQAARNANDGISLAQTTEGALGQINDNLQRIRELTVQAENGTNSQKDLNSIQAEITQRLEEVDRISRETEFNGVTVLAKDQEFTIQVGANDGQKITMNLKEITAEKVGLSDYNVNGYQGALTNDTDASGAMAAALGLDGSETWASGASADLAAELGTITFGTAAGAVAVPEGFTATNADLKVDEAGNFFIEGQLNGETAFVTADISVISNSEGDITGISVKAGDFTGKLSESPLAAIDAAMEDVAGVRSELGAMQNRFESAITNLNTTSTNLSAARSRIEDADYAVEVSEMTRSQILQQAGTSVLAQANQVPQSVLSLLG